MNDSDISQYFSEFSPTPKQLRKLVKLLKGIHKRWGIEYGDSVIEATLLLAPENLARLSPAALGLLARCRNRIWAFDVSLDREYDPFHKQTYLEVFDLLLSLGLIVEASLPNKLKGAKKVDDLRRLLKAKGLSDKGKKEELTDRVMENYSTEELENLVKGIILFQTTEVGDKTLQTITELRSSVGVAFRTAVVGTMRYFEPRREPVPTLPPGVYYDDGEVRITEEDIVRATETPSSIPTAKTPMDSKQRQATLSLELIQGLVLAIESSGDGWLTVLTSNDKHAHFVQGSFMESHPNRQWCFDASGDTHMLSILGFVEIDGRPLPMQWVSGDKVTETILDTLWRAFSVGLGTTVWIDYEIAGK